MSTELDKVLSKVRKLIEEQILSLLCDKLINKNNVLKHINLDNKFLVLPANEYEIFNKYISNGHNKEQFDKWVIFKWEEKTYHAMTVQEYIDKNLPFYHITPAINKDGILRGGLHCGKAVKAICVVRSDDKDIWRDIAESQLSAGGKHNEFIVIKLLPRTHGIKAVDVAQDTIQERTSPLHNYIVKKVINVAEGDFIDNFSIKEGHGKPVDKCKIQSLTGYLREGLPMLSDDLKRLLGED